MVIKMENKIYKLKGKGKDLYKEDEEKIYDLLKSARIACSFLSDHVSGDCMSYLNTSLETRMELYELVASKFGYYIKFEESTKEEIISL